MVEGDVPEDGCDEVCLFRGYVQKATVNQQTVLKGDVSKLDILEGNVAKGAVKEPVIVKKA